MSNRRVFHPVRGFLLVVKNLFLLAAVLIAAFGIVGFFAGWIEFRHDDQHDRATIEIKTNQVKATAEDAVDKGKELFGEAADEVEDAADEVEEAADDLRDDEPDSDANEATDGDA